MGKVNFSAINEIMDFDFSTVESIDDLKVAIKTFQENFKDLPNNLKVALTEVSDNFVDNLKK